MRSTPIPAANSMAVHVNRLNWGFAWSGPILMVPCLLAATRITNTITRAAVRM